MTAVEKASELIDKYSFVEIANYTSVFEVKQCALITIDEILNIIDGFDLERTYNYWKEVKQEILTIKSK